MNKEFLFNKWFRKHLTSGRFAVIIMVMIAFAILCTMIIPNQIGMAIMDGLLIAILVAVIPIIGWQAYWQIKYPPQVDFCKECGRAKPIKYED